MIKALQQLTDRIEQTNSLDSVIAFAKENAGPIMKQPMVSKVLSGDFLGHPLHPMLTDIPIGAWSMSALLASIHRLRLGPAADIPDRH